MIKDTPSEKTKDKDIGSSKHVGSVWEWDLCHKLWASNWSETTSQCQSLRSKHCSLLTEATVLTLDTEWPFLNALLVLLWSTRWPQSLFLICPMNMQQCNSLDKANFRLTEYWFLLFKIRFVSLDNSNIHLLLLLLFFRNACVYTLSISEWISHLSFDMDFHISCVWILGLTARELRYTL